MSKTINKKKQKNNIPKNLKKLYGCFEALGVSILKILEMSLKTQDSVIKVEKIIDCQIKNLEFRMYSHIQRIEKNLKMYGLDDDEKKVSH